MTICYFGCQSATRRVICQLSAGMLANSALGICTSYGVCARKTANYSLVVSFAPNRWRCTRGVVRFGPAAVSLHNSAKKRRNEINFYYRARVGTVPAVNYYGESWSKPENHRRKSGAAKSQNENIYIIFRQLFSPFAVATVVTSSSSSQFRNRDCLTVSCRC